MKKVLVAMSGGVDSSACAYLLQSSGQYECIGVTMKLFAEKSDEDFADAKAVCDKLGIEHRVVDLSTTFRQHVMNYFADSYLNGTTPNPCIECNKHLKFGALLDIADELGCDYLATGHYAHIEFNQDLDKYVLKKADDHNKDQSYFLYALTQKQLARTLFPLGGMSKDEIRRVAEEQNLVTAKKPDSQDVCFLPDGNYTDFLEKYTGKHLKKGIFTDKDGRLLGESKGQAAYTIGQRKGLGISAAHPLYVCNKDAAKNIVVLGDESSLYSTVCIADDFVSEIYDFSQPRRINAKIRYRKPEQPATAVQIGNRLEIHFDEPQKSVCPGQAVVLYDKDMVIGGGTIIA